MKILHKRMVHWFLLLVLTLSVWLLIDDPLKVSAERIEVTSDRVPITGKVQWWQIDNGYFRAQSILNEVEVPMIGERDNPRPSSNEINVMFDLTKYPMPTTFEDKKTGKSYKASEVIDIEALNPEWNENFNGRTYRGQSKRIVYKTNLEVVITSGGILEADKVEQYGSSPPPNPQPKFNVEYLVPMYVQWKGYIDTGNNGGGENGGGDPNPGGGESCPKPGEVPKRYEHELDLIVSRLDARTVDLNTNTKTDVYVERADFSSSREQAKQEFNDYISDTKSKKADCEALIQGWEAEKAAAEATKASAEAAKASCQSRPVGKDEPAPDCSGYDSTISSAEATIAEKDVQISDGKAMLPIYDEKIKKAEDELAYIKSNESKYQTVQPVVDLKYDGTAVGVITVSLSEGQKQRYSFPGWKVTQQGKDIMAQINSSGPYEEFEYTELKGRQAKSLGYNAKLGHVLYSNTASNNWKDTTQYVATYQGAACPVFESGQYFKTQTVQDIVRTVNENGNKRNIYETLTTSFTKLPRKEMRAGYGFDYTITSIYRNNDTEPEPAESTGTKVVESYFPTLVDYQPYKRGGAKVSFDLNGNPKLADEGYLVGMDTKDGSSPRNETRNWILPPVAIEEFSGNIFTMNNKDHLLHDKRNFSETLLTTDKKGRPLTKWYTNFTDPNGSYNFRVRTFDAGVNHLNTCHNGNVIIDGTTTGDKDGNDDYVKRAVTTEDPFPAGVGWNWNGKVGNISSLSNWYLSWYRKPSQLSLSQYAATFYLTPKTIAEINAYTSKHSKLIMGESVLDQVNVPTKKE
ncbi:hypothetical protein [Lysinibacillus sphaericus]|uniref:hypothetical protein n=1 Tax=Lysinibacillus sphaericus TaxID=1421 RepID=UPI0018CED4D0|nr:hypothetical protein [Lysinibacillus sphaericus]